MVLNHVKEPISEDILQLIERTGLEVLGHLPTDPLIERISFNSSSILDIPDESAAFRAMRDISLALEL